MTQAPDRLGRYQVLASLGKGRFGEVYRVRHPDLARDLVARLCSIDDAEVREAFVEEGQRSVRLVQPHIVRTYEIGDHEGAPFLVQELVPGETLDEILENNPPRTPVSSLDLLRQVGRALEHAHGKDVIHRALRPACIHRTPDGTIKVRDFGLARLVSTEHQVSQQTVTLEDAGYLSPEQVRGETVDRRADVFSFGVLAYRLLTGEAPFGGSHLSALIYQILYKVPLSPSAVWPECPGPLADLILRCLEKKPDDRLAEVTEVLEGFAKIRDEAVGGRWPGLLAARQPEPTRALPTDPESTVISPLEISQTARALADGEATVAVPLSALEAGVDARRTMRLGPEAAEGAAKAASREGRESAPPGLAHGPTVQMPKVEAPTVEASTVEMPVTDVKAQLPPLPPLPPTAGDIREMATTPMVVEVAVSREAEMVGGETVAVAADSLEARAMQQGLQDRDAATREPAGSAVPDVDAGDETVARLVDPSPAPATREEEVGRAPARFDGDPELEEAASEISRLVANGDLDAARKALDQTILSRTGLAPAPLEDVFAAVDSGSSSQLPRRGRGGRPMVWFLVLVVAATLTSGLAYWMTREVSPPAAVVSVQDPVATQVDLQSVPVEAHPWGRLMEITALDGSPVELPEQRDTPLRLELPVGAYRLTFRHPDSLEEGVCEIDVTPEGAQACVVELFHPSANEFFRAAGWWK